MTTTFWEAGGCRAVGGGGVLLLLLFPLVDLMKPHLLGLSAPKTTPSVRLPRETARLNKSAGEELEMHAWWFCLFILFNVMFQPKKNISRINGFNCCDHAGLYFVRCSSKNNRNCQLYTMWLQTCFTHTFYPNYFDVLKWISRLETSEVSPFTVNIHSVSKATLVKTLPWWCVQEHANIQDISESSARKCHKSQCGNFFSVVFHNGRQLKHFYSCNEMQHGFPNFSMPLPSE